MINQQSSGLLSPRRSEDDYIVKFHLNHNITRNRTLSATPSTPRDRDSEIRSPSLGKECDFTSADEAYVQSPERGRGRLRRDSALGQTEPTRNQDGKIICEHPMREKGCEKLVFERRCDWAKHIDKHSRPYKCSDPLCKDLRGFTYSGGLLRHQREVHKADGARRTPFYCPIMYCKRSVGAGFTRKENLNEHVRRVHRLADGGVGKEVELLQHVHGDGTGCEQEAEEVRVKPDRTAEDAMITVSNLPIVPQPSPPATKTTTEIVQIGITRGESESSPDSKFNLNLNLKPALKRKRSSSPPSHTEPQTRSKPDPSNIDVTHPCVDTTPSSPLLLAVASDDDTTTANRNIQAELEYLRRSNDALYARLKERDMWAEGLERVVEERDVRMGKLERDVRALCERLQGR